MKFDASQPPPADLVRCETCGKPKGYKGYRGPECQCRPPAPAAAAHSIKVLSDDQLAERDGRP